MKVRVLVSLEEIDNGWLDPARKASTCAVAQALVNAKIVRDKRGVDVLNDTVLLRLPNDGDQSVFTVSLAFSEWIGKFDRWTAIRSKYQKWRKECAELRRLGRTDFPPMPTVKGKPVPPVTVIIDPEEQHVSIEGEPASKSERVILPKAHRDQFARSLLDNFKALVQLGPHRFNPLFEYLQVVSGRETATGEFVDCHGVVMKNYPYPGNHKMYKETGVKPVSNYSGYSGEAQAHSPEKCSASALRDRIRKNQIGSKHPKTPSLYSSEFQAKADRKS